MPRQMKKLPWPGSKVDVKKEVQGWVES
jgi:hypothetical protein